MEPVQAWDLAAHTYTYTRTDTQTYTQWGRSLTITAAGPSLPSAFCARAELKAILTMVSWRMWSGLDGGAVAGAARTAAPHTRCAVTHFAASALAALPVAAGD